MSPLSQKPDAARSKEGGSTFERQARRSSEPSPEPGAKARILAADDLPEVLRLVERSLGSGYRCEFATSVAAAQEKLGGPPFDLALCGLEAPGESGLALAEEIARDHAETAIVMVTGADDPEVAERAFQLGAHGYLVKPFWPGQLPITVANALRQHQLELAERRRQTALLGSAAERTEALRHELIETQRKAIGDLQVSRQEAVERLASTIEMYDPEAGRHVNRVASITALLGAKLGLDAGRVLLLRAAAPMHDVGKIATPDGVLQKLGRLTRSERERMEAHTTVGYTILADSESELLKVAATIALTHHEWFDGSGYPQGLGNGEIPIEGRAAAVADVLDALLSERPYRPAMTTEQATQLIVGESGTHFDPEVVGALMANLDQALALRG